MALLITDIGELVTNDPEAPGADPASGSLGIVRDAAVLVSPDGRGGRSRVEWVGPRGDAPQDAWEISVEGRAAVPGFVDSHTHLVYAGDRAEEFCARMFGDEYDGGGIANTVRATREASDATLRGLLAARVKELRGQGTTTVEIKSGYGLDVEHEARMLELAREVTDETTFLGGHVVPPEYADRRAEYVELVTGPMLDACAPYSRWGDVFCEPNSPHAFTGEESEAILRACAAKGLELRVHGNQIGHGPGAQLAVELGAASVDHCTYLSDADVAALAGSETVATLLPGVEFSTKSPYPDARRLIDAGVRVAIASDCNPGTCNSSSMPLMIALAVREMGLRPAEALQAATVHAAAALRRTDVGVVKAGAIADIAVLDAPSYLHLAYRPGVPIAHALEV